MAGSVLALALSACPGVATPLKRPQMTVAETTAIASSQSDGSPRLRMRLTAVNRNSSALVAQAIDWHFALADEPPVRGRSELAVTVPADGTASIEVELPLPSTSVAALTRLLRSGQRDYRVSGTVHYASKRGDLGAVFDDAGILSGEPALQSRP